MKRKITFDDMGMDWNPNAPPRSRVWRDMNNMRTHEGVLSKRAYLKLPNANHVVDDSSYGGTGSAVRHVFNTGGGPLILTDSDAWLFGESLALTYNAGTVSVSNGSTAVSGSGTAWLDINMRDLIELPSGSGEWYAMSAVGGGTSITLSVPFTGTTLSGASYTVRRQGGGLGAWTTFNGDLYLYYDFYGTAQGALIKVSDYFSAPSATALASAVSAIDGCDVFESFFFPCTGIVGLPDGRIVLASGNTPGLGFGSRVRYSDHLDTTKWVTGNSGFTDPVGIPGVISGAEWLGQEIVFYYGDGVQVATLTGQDREPMVFRAVPGPLGPGAQTLIALPDQSHYFVIFDSLPCRYDGVRQELLGDSLRDLVFPTTLMSSGYQGSREELSVCRENIRYSFSLKDQVWRKDSYKHSVSFALGASVNIFTGGASAPDVVRDVLAGPTEASAMPCLSVEGTSADETGTFGGYSDGGFFAETDDFDLRSASGDDSVEFVVDTVEVWARGRIAASEDLSIGVSQDGGVAYSSVTRTLSLDASEEVVYRFQGFTRRAKPLARVKITLPSTGVSAIEISKLVVHVTEAGHIGRRGLP